jgi:alpha-galactosidase
MLVVGLDNKGFIKEGPCSDIEYRTQMSMWCMFAAPLIIGTDVRNLRPAALEILSNPEIIAIDQDPLGIQAHRVFEADSTDVYKKPLIGGRFAVALLNRGELPAKITASWQALSLDQRTKCKVRDVWTHADLGTFTDAFSAELAPHECKVLTFKP